MIKWCTFFHGTCNKKAVASYIYLNNFHKPKLFINSHEAPKQLITQEGHWNNQRHNSRFYVHFVAVPKEVQLVKREYFNRWYGLKPYYAALVVSRTPATIFFSLIYIAITYPLTSQPLEWDRILKFTAICIMVALTSESMGTVISSMLNVVVSTIVSSFTNKNIMSLNVN